jgi:hypothetical protein
LKIFKYCYLKLIGFREKIFNLGGGVCTKVSLVKIKGEAREKLGKEKGKIKREEKRKRGLDSW